MLYFDRIDISEGINVNKISPSKECDICHYWHFLCYSFKFQPNVCNRCDDLLMMSMSLSDIAILNNKGLDYRCIISLIRKIEAINLMQNPDLTEKRGTFGDIEIEKNKFCRCKNPVFLKDVDVEKVLLSNNISFGEKFINTLLFTCIIIIKLSRYI